MCKLMDKLCLHKIGPDRSDQNYISKIKKLILINFRSLTFIFIIAIFILLLLIFLQIF